MKLYGIVDAEGNDADDFAYESMIDAGIAADDYAKQNGKSYLVKELCEVGPGVSSK